MNPQCIHVYDGGYSAMPKCKWCGIPIVSAALFRVNPKGETPAQWSCETCAVRHGITIPPDVRDITRTIEDRDA